MIGETVSHYRVLGKLGEGGMGVVDEAEDAKLKRTVGLMSLPPGMTRDAQPSGASTILSTSSGR